jgi:hypothetical protein
MKNWFLLTFLLLGTVLHAQNFVATSFHASDLLPRPYVFVGPEGMGSGYAPFALIGGAGVRIDSEHFILETEAWYDNGHKSGERGKPNPKGHDLGLVGSMYYRLPSVGHSAEAPAGASYRPPTRRKGHGVRRSAAARTSSSETARRSSASTSSPCGSALTMCCPAATGKTGRKGLRSWCIYPLPR